LHLCNVEFHLLSDAFVETGSQRQLLSDQGEKTLPSTVPRIAHARPDPGPDAPAPAGFVTFTLHAHLPYVINHGTWPHGIEWLFEAAAETYIPLLQMLGRLERDDIALRANLDLSPILLEQLAHPAFVAEFPNYVTRKIVAAREDEAFFLQSGDLQLAGTAKFWQDFYVRTLIDFNALGRDIAAGFRRFNDDGLIRIITSAATHGFLPLLGTDESVRAQVQLAIDTHVARLGVAPRGVWLPECGYRPAGFWEYPAVAEDRVQVAPGFEREGVEDILTRAGLRFFFVDTHLVERATTTSLKPERRSRGRNAGGYRPHCAVSPSKFSPSDVTCQNASATVFARDPRTAVQVWSSDAGYPGDFNYLDFHKKRFPGGHRYWKVTGANVDIADKQTWDVHDATDRVKVHAAHFAEICQEALKAATGRQPAQGSVTPPILCALFDAELFGHWWFEGVLWLEAVARELHQRALDRAPTRIELIDCESYLERYPATDAIAMQEGSWGSGGSSQVWLNPQTSWVWARIYPAELYVRQMTTEGRWRNSELGIRIARQICRELLLMESSDWPFLIATGAARDYAEQRFATHSDCFNELRAIYSHWLLEQTISRGQEVRLGEIELRDSVFMDLDPGLWATAGP